VSGYRSIKVSDETAFDLARLLWMAERLNAREGNYPSSPQARQAEALARVVREHSAMIVSQVAHEPDFMPLVKADWRCACGSSGLGTGGLVVVGERALCRPCEAQTATTHAATGDRPS
jgi:hypothetical protein